MQTSRPGTITAAAILWIIYGSLGLIGNLSTLSHGFHANSIVGFAFAIAFLSAGIQALTGRASGLLASGIVSIILGALVLIAFLLLGSMFRAAGIHVGMAVLAVIGLVFGGMLIVAGILACVGNAKFKEWRQSKGL